MYFPDRISNVSGVFYVVLICFQMNISAAVSVLEFFIGPSLGRNSVKSKSLDIVPAVSKVTF